MDGHRRILSTLRSASMRRRAWLPVLLVALLFAGLGQATHLHKPDAAGNAVDRDHCAYCLQFERLAAAPSNAPLHFPAATAFPAIAWRAIRASTPAPAHRYDARGPPLR
jgi:hypothetical protein